MVVALAVAAILLTAAILFGGAQGASAASVAGCRVCQTASPRPSTTATRTPTGRPSATPSRPRPSTSTASSTPSRTPVPTVTLSAGQQVLPQTGSPTTGVYRLGALLVAAGAALVVLAARRRRPAPR